MAAERIETSFTTLTAAFDRPVEDAPAWYTLYYVWSMHRAGVLVTVDDGRVTRVIPFVNPRYDNTLPFHGAPPLTCCGSAEAPRPTTVADHYRAKAAAHGRAVEAVLPHVREWWVNGHVVCNVVDPGRPLWNLRGLRQLADLLRAAVPHTGLTRARLVVNKRDFPCMKLGCIESPFDAVFGCSAPAPMHHMWTGVARYVRPLSLYGGPRWYDALLPVPEHWDLAEAAGGDGGTGGGDGASVAPWEARQPRAVFRGTATGAGATVATNVRLRLAAWGLAHRELADVGLTAFSERDRVEGGRVTYMDPCALMARGIHPCAPLSPQQQAAQFKYQIYVDGHCASSRLAWLLLSGSLILYVTPDARVTAPHQWFSHHLAAGVHYVPVAADLGDLAAKIEWARAHDADARAIAAAARALGRRLLTRDEMVRAAAAAVVAAVGGPPNPVGHVATVGSDDRGGIGALGT